MFLKLSSLLRLGFASALLALLAACQPASNSTEPESAAANADPAPATAPAAPEATTQYGPVRGFMDGSIEVFKGIRYGADTATTRFAPPAPPAAWTEPMDALAYGNSSPQPPRGGLSLFDSWLPDPSPEMSEDCLFLNVWTPALDAEAKLPVMVWIHGGSFVFGERIMYKH